KMPHFYGLSNNHPSVLPADQKMLPDAEIHAIADYLFEVSRQYLRDVAAQHESDQKQPQARAEDEQRLTELLAKGKDKLSDKEKDELTAIRRRGKLRKEKILTDRPPDRAGDAAGGRQLFSEKGCLACHSHEGTTAPAVKAGDDNVPPVKSVALFGPNLSQVAA